MQLSYRTKIAESAAIFLIGGMQAEGGGTRLGAKDDFPEGLACFHPTMGVGSLSERYAQSTIGFSEPSATDQASNCGNATPWPA